MTDRTAPQVPHTAWTDDDRIESVDVREFVVPLKQPVRNGTALISEREYVMVTIRTASGATGVACVFTRRVPIGQIVRDFLGPQLVGRSAFAIQLIWRDLYQSGELFFGRSGAFPRALSLLDIALWDLHGRLLGRSVSDILGGSGAQVPVLLALGYYQSGDELELLRAEYSQLSALGFRRFKMMAGGASVEHDLRRVAAIFDVLPDDATLGIDVNGAWGTAREALTFLEGIERPIAFIEDPFRPTNATALRELGRLSPVAIAVGEWESGRHRFRRLLEEDLIDIARIDATAAGGISEWMKIAALATSFDKRILPHYYPEIHIHLAAATPTTEAVEVVPSLTGADNFEQIVKTVPWQEQPISVPSRAPGLGIEWNHELIDQLSRGHR